MTDRQGSTRALINQEGHLEQAYAYLPFGGFMDVSGETEAAMPYLYTSQEWDNETKLYNYKARFYDPAIGRFFATDAAGEFASPYVYCGNNPIMLTDSSGNMSEAGWASLAGGVAIIAGIGITVFTAGAGTSVAIGGALAAGVLIGGGSSSLGYSLGAGDDWNAAAWAGNVIVGMGLGAASANLAGIKVGVSAASSGVRSIAGRSIAKIGAGIVAGAAGDAAVSVAMTAAYNGITGAPLGAGLGAAAVGGALGGALAVGGGIGAGIPAGSKLFKRYSRGAGVLTQDSKELFFDNRRMPIFNIEEDRARALARDPRHPGGAVGILHVGNRDMHLGQFTADQTTEGFGPSHAQQARHHYGNDPNGGEFLRVRDVQVGDTIEKRATYPNLRGFTLIKTSSNSATIGYNSITLNGYRGEGVPEGGTWLNSPQQRMQILTGLREAGIGVSLVPRINTYTSEEITVARYLSHI